MQFQVPQFIEVEDKIFGPFTLRQFIYLAGGAGLCYLLYAILPFFISIFGIALVATFACMLAFYKYNSRPFIEFVESFFKYSTGNHLYIWKKVAKIPETMKKQEVQKELPKIALPKLSDSKLKDLSWSLDIHENRNNKI